MSDGRLAATLKALIKDKEKRDNQRFTPATLAGKIGVDRSLIQRLLNNEVKNPRIDTLIKIANFFIADGVNLRLDDLVGLPRKEINISDQKITLDRQTTLPLFSMSNFTGIKSSTISVSTPHCSPGLIALQSEHDIKPIFKAGSIFIVDTTKPTKVNNLIAMKQNSSIVIAKLIKENEAKILGGDKSIPALSDKTLGVIIRINAKT